LHSGESAVTVVSAQSRIWDSCLTVRM